MRFLKAETLVTDSRGNTVIDGTGGLVLPAGTTAERPTVDFQGSMRYNTDTNAVEIYTDGSWQLIKAPAADAIQKQTLGPSDGTETVFGPLLEQPANDDNILVLVENVLQISGTNFNVVYSDGIDGGLGPNAPYAAGYYIKFTDAVPAVNPGSGAPIYITVLYGFV